MKSKTTRKKVATVSKRPFASKAVRTRFKKLKKDFITAAKKLFSSTEYDYNLTWDSVAEKIAEKWDLKKFYHNGLSAVAFKSKKFGLILKAPYLCSESKTPSHGIYTTIFRVNPPHQDWDCFFIQPLADVSKKAKEKAHSILMEARADDVIECSDMHSDNVAIYNGKAVAIDW